MDVVQIHVKVCWFGVKLLHHFQLLYQLMWWTNLVCFRSTSCDRCYLSQQRFYIISAGVNYTEPNTWQNTAHHYTTLSWTLCKSRYNRKKWRSLNNIVHEHTHLVTLPEISKSVSNISSWETRFFGMPWQQFTDVRPSNLNIINAIVWTILELWVTLYAPELKWTACWTGMSQQWTDHLNKYCSEKKSILMI